MNTPALDNHAGLRPAGPFGGGGYRRPHVRTGRGVTIRLRNEVWLILAGISLALIGLIWWAVSRPSRGETLTAKASCYVGRSTYGVSGESCDGLSASTAGPIVLAVLGGFVVLCGVILISRQRPDWTPTPTPPPPPPFDAA